jgi:undecaprenyl-diphosphatase
MNWIEALILGIVQGLTEFLPVSSSGHLEIGKALLGVAATESLNFSVAVHGATVLSTLVVFRKDIIEIFGGFFKFQWNDETKYVSKILLSMVPVAIVGVFIKDWVKSFYGEGNVMFVGFMLLITAFLLGLTHFVKAKARDIKFSDAFVIGIAQAFAVLPGISRSGSTIATGLFLGNKREAVTRFSFLMVLIPILGENLLDILSGGMTENSQIGILPLGIGFLAAFISGLFACSWMLKIVKKGKLIYFAIYCLIIGVLAIALA